MTRITTSGTTSKPDVFDVTFHDISGDMRSSLVATVNREEAKSQHPARFAPTLEEEFYWILAADYFTDDEEPYFKIVGTSGDDRWLRVALSSEYLDGFK